jgi:HK97 family phage portal protein
MRLPTFLGGRTAPAPRASFQPAGGGTLIVSPQQLEEALRTGNLSAAGEAVTAETAMRVATVYACVRIIAGVLGTLPIDIKRRIDDRTRADASDHPVWQLIRRRPNQWQKPNQFKAMLQAHVCLRGNAYALIVPGVRGPQALIPLHPGRVRTQQLDDMSIVHDWTRKNGSTIRLRQEEVFHLFGLSFDGITGVTPLTYARETIGTSLAMSKYAGQVLGKGARVSGALQSKNSLTDKAFSRLKESMEDFRAGGDREGDYLILEEGLEWKAMALSLVDLQWIEAQKLSRSEICMYYGVPPSMIGDNSGSDSNWGTGLEQKSIGLVTYGFDPHFVMWEEGITADLIAEPDVYARINRGALIRGDMKTRYAAYASALQWGHLNPDEVRELEDRNPRADGRGGDFYDPPNTAGGDTTSKGLQDDPQQPPAK